MGAGGGGGRRAEISFGLKFVELPGSVVRVWFSFSGPAAENMVQGSCMS